VAFLAVHIKEYSTTLLFDNKMLELMQYKSSETNVLNVPMHLNPTAFITLVSKLVQLLFEVDHIESDLVILQSGAIQVW